MVWRANGPVVDHVYTAFGGDLFRTHSQVVGMRQDDLVLAMAFNSAASVVWSIDYRVSPPTYGFVPHAWGVCRQQ